ncbi:protein of unknown function [Paraburkholderia dioscoreae]|uniref:Uncharacterized protein n=1 Tax=Paraburkholderia dioscoreae TaxID=2604047 RepID=A0A5Q4ZFY2_9BURK|nr:protein of unknown function [Paraburkholderia dioscoreae]
MTKRHSNTWAASRRKNATHAMFIDSRTVSSAACAVDISRFQRVRSNASKEGAGWHGGCLFMPVFNIVIIPVRSAWRDLPDSRTISIVRISDEKRDELPKEWGLARAGGVFPLFRHRLYRLGSVWTARAVHQQEHCDDARATRFAGGGAGAFGRHSACHAR